MPNATTLTAATAISGDLATSRVTSDWAGEFFSVAGARAGHYITAHLYGPGRTDTIAARLKTLALPASLPPGKYDLSLRLEGEASPLRVPFVVYAADTEPSPAPAPDRPATPGENQVKRMRVGLVDAAKVAYAALSPYIAGWCTSVRVWADSGDFAEYRLDDNAQNAMTYERAGVSVIWCVAQDHCTPKMFARAPAYVVAMIEDLVRLYDGTPHTRGRTIRLQIGNEPDLRIDGEGEYWTGSIAEYAAGLQAVYQAVKATKHAGRVQIVAAGFSWDIGRLEQHGAAIAAGCDAMAFHGYPPRLDAANLRPIERFVALCRQHGKPSVITEGSPGYGVAVKTRERPITDWDRDWPRYLLALDRLGVDECQLFSAWDIKTTNSAGALFVKSGLKITPTPRYAAVKTAVAA